jgi:hypothetical protein
VPGDLIKPETQNNLQRLFIQTVTAHIFAELPNENNLQAKLWNKIVEKYIIIKIVTQLLASKNNLMEDCP